MAYARVLSEAGASLKRDATDKRVISNVFNGTATEGENGIISFIEDSDYDVYENVTRDASFDANQNGIADWYEKALDITDAQTDPDGDGYTCLEDYLNYMATPNTAINAGETATFDLTDYFSGLRNPVYTTSGEGTINGTTLNITSTATSQGFLRATVTATAGEVSISRDFVVYINGTKDGIQPTQLKEAHVQSYQLYNTAGILICQGNGYGAAPSQLNLQDVPSGVYLMKIVDQDGRTRSYSVLKR